MPLRSYFLLAVNLGMWRIFHNFTLPLCTANINFKINIQLKMWFGFYLNRGYQTMIIIILSMFNSVSWEKRRRSTHFSSLGKKKRLMEYLNAVTFRATCSSSVGRPCGIRNVFIFTYSKLLGCRMCLRSQREAEFSSFQFATSLTDCRCHVCISYKI